MGFIAAGVGRSCLNCNSTCNNVDDVSKVQYSNLYNVPLTMKHLTSLHCSDGFCVKMPKMCISSTEFSVPGLPYILYDILAAAAYQVRSTHRNVNALQVAFRRNEELSPYPPASPNSSEDEQPILGNHTEREGRSKMVRSIFQ